MDDLIIRIILSCYHVIIFHYCYHDINVVYIILIFKTRICTQTNYYKDDHFEAQENTAFQTQSRLIVKYYSPFIN